MEPVRTKGIWFFDTAVNDAVVNFIIFDKFRNGTAAAHPVDYIQVIIMAVCLRFLSIDVLSQGLWNMEPSRSWVARAFPAMRPST